MLDKPRKKCMQKFSLGIMMPSNAFWKQANEDIFSGEQGSKCFKIPKTILGTRNIEIKT